jgi:hypothetical protein
MSHQQKERISAISRWQQMEFTEKWAILLGPSKYQRVRPLNFSTKDVQDVKNSFKKYLEFQDDHILSFGDGLQFPPTRADFYDALGKFLKTNLIRPEHLLVFYFSGHGVRDKKDYLLPIEASPNDLGRTGIEVDDLVGQLAGTGCSNVVMFIDACREAISGQKGTLGFGEHSKSVLERSATITFFSCDPTDLSYEIPELNNGSFTYCLLKAIESGKYETVGQVYDFLLKELPTTNSLYNKPPQKPYAVIIPDEKRDLPLFYSVVHKQQEQGEYDSLVERLQDCIINDKVDPKYWACLNFAIVLLDSVKTFGLKEEDKPKLRNIKRFCSGELDAEAFRVFWDVVERRQKPLGPPKTKTGLEPLK